MVWQEVCRGLDGLYLVRKDGVWQSRSLTDRTGAVWWGVLWFGSRGWVCLGAMRRGTLRFGSRGLDRSGLIRRGLVWQSRIGRDGCGTVNRGGVWYGSHGSER
jgi:hypothetical protein